MYFRLGVIVVVILAAASSLTSYYVTETILNKPHIVKDHFYNYFNKTIIFSEWTAGWHPLKPKITASNIIIQTKKPHHFFKIKKLHAKLNLLSSILHKRPVFALIYIDGLTLTVVEEENQTFSVAEIIDIPLKSLLAALNLDRSKSIDVNENQQMTNNNFLSILLNQREIIIANTKIYFSQKNKIHDVQLSDIHVSNHFSQSIIKGKIEVNDAKKISPEANQLQFSVRLNKRTVINKELSGEFFLDFNYSSLGNLYSWLNLNDFKFENSKGKFRLWGNIEDSELVRLQGSIQLAESVLNIPSSQQVNAQQTEYIFPVPFFEALINYKKYAVTEILELSKVELNINNNFWSGGTLQIQRPLARKLTLASHINATRIQINQLPILFMRSIISLAPIVPQNYLSLLEKTQLTGTLEKISMVIPNKQDRKDQFHFLSYFKNVSSIPTENIPAVKFADGYISFGSNKGIVALDSDSTQIQAPNFIPGPIATELLLGAIKWTKTPDYIKVISNEVYLKTKDSSGKALFTVKVYPKDKKLKPELRLLASIFNGDLSSKSHYLPRKKLKPNLVRWIDRAIVSGKLDRGDFLYHGPVTAQPSERLLRTFQMRYKVSNSELNYLEPWEKITLLNAQVTIDGNGTHVNATSGKVFNSELFETTAVIPAFDENKPPRILIKGNIRGSTEDSIRFLEQSPLSRFLGDLKGKISGKGDALVKLDIEIPLKKNKQQNSSMDYKQNLHNKTSQHNSQIKVDVGLSNTDLALELAQPVNIESLQGNILYETESGLVADNLTANLFGYPIQGKITTEVKSGKLLKTEVNFNGDVAVKKLADWNNLNIFKFLEGTMSYQAAIKIHNKQYAGNLSNVLLIESDLKNIKTNFPAALAKQKQEQLPFKLQIALEKEPLIQFNYGAALSGALAVRNGQLERARFHFGKEDMQHPHQSGIAITGYLSKLDIKEWAGFVQQLVNDENNQQPSTKKIADKVQKESVSNIPIRWLDLNIEKISGLGYLDSKLNQSHISIWNVEQEWHCAIENPLLSLMTTLPNESFLQLVQGKPFLQQPKDEKILLNFNYLKLPKKTEEDSAITLKQESSLDDQEKTENTLANPKNWPPLNIKVQQLSIAEKHWGQWSVVTFSDLKGVHFENIRGELEGFTLKSSGIWEISSADSNSTVFQGKVSGSNIAAILQHLGFEPTLISKSAELEFEIGWLHRPTQFVLQGASGDFKMLLKNGRLLEVEPTASTLRITGLLNIDTLKRRLMLNFKDLYQKGLAFDDISGQFELQSNTLFTKKIIIDGPAADFEIKGNTNLQTNLTDHVVKVTLPLSNNLVLPAAAAAGLPGAATAFVIEKALGNKINKLTTFKVKVQGDWRNPSAETNN